MILYSCPTYKVAKWLVQKFESLGPPDSFSAKNSYEAAKILNGYKVEADEILVSFDVVSLFSNVPMNDELTYLEEHLYEKSFLRGHDLATLIFLTEICMYNSHFQFRGNYYKLKDGVAKGNPLSPFLADVFMAHVEKELSKERIFPRLWLRYVLNELCTFSSFFSNECNSYQSYEIYFKRSG